MLRLMNSFLLSSRALRTVIAPRGYAPQARGRQAAVAAAVCAACVVAWTACFARVFFRAPRVCATTTLSAPTRLTHPVLHHYDTYVCIRTYVDASPRSVAIADCRSSELGDPRASGAFGPIAAKKMKILSLSLYSCSAAAGRGPRTFASPRSRARERLAACAAATPSARIKRNACSRRRVLSFRVCDTTLLGAFTCVTHRTAPRSSYPSLCISSCICIRITWYRTFCRFVRVCSRACIVHTVLMPVRIAIRGKQRVTKQIEIKRTKHCLRVSQTPRA